MTASHVQPHALDAHPTGSFVGRYQILRRIGLGGMGAVYEATHIDLGKRVALKVLRAEFASNAAVRARFLREARAASRIRHAHVADVTDVGEHEGVPFLVMELLTGEDLSTMLQREAPFAPTLTADLMLPVIAAMHVAHEEGVVHRDLKPANIFLSRDRYGQLVPKIVDFGISKIADAASQDLTGTEALLGTPYYMAPEQVEGARHTGPASDQFALGVILYCCLTRQLPFRGASAFATMQAIVSGVFVPASHIVPGLPIELDRIIARTLALDPNARYPTLNEFGAELLTFASPEVQSHWRPVFAPVAVPRPPTMPPPRQVAQTVPMETPPVLVSSAPPPVPSFTPPSTLATATRPVISPGTPRRSATRILVPIVAALALSGAGVYAVRYVTHTTPPPPVAVSPPPRPAPAPAPVVQTPPPRPAPAPAPVVQAPPPPEPAPSPVAIVAPQVVPPDAASPHAVITRRPVAAPQRRPSRAPRTQRAHPVVEYTPDGRTIIP